MIRAHNCDFVVAVGGGSVLDCAKAAAVMCTAEYPVRAYMQDASLMPQTRIPLIAVPTSVGYGASFGGLSALLSMLNSCASGVSVVNIDNGFGAGYLASMINHLD
jgi:alcohol dehydrogenase class IV